MNSPWELSSDEKKKLRQWWDELDKNRGDRAQLRRAETPEDVLLTPAFAHFLNMMPARWSGNALIKLTDSAAVAAVLSRVKEREGDSSFAKALALPKQQGSDRPAMSELRFQQLQKSRTEEEFFRRLCRAVRMLGDRANIVSLAEDILHWLLESRAELAFRPQDRLAVRWASDYYANLRD